MECSIKNEKIQAMKIYKRAKFLYDFVLYSLTFFITIIFFSYVPFCFLSMNQFLTSLPNNIFFLFNAKCFFILGNLIVLILIGESKLKRSSKSYSALDIYNEYAARSRSSYHKVNSKEIVVNGASIKSPCIDQENRHGSCGEKINRDDKKKGVLRASKSTTRLHHEEKKTKMRVSKSAVWGESEIAKMEKTMGEKENRLSIPKEELNKRVEAFIAKVNKQRLLEAKLVD